MPANPIPDPLPADAGKSPVDAQRFTFERSLVQLRRRLITEATTAVHMFEMALEALWRIDHGQAKEVRRLDDTIDREEVEIERECFRLLALQTPVAKDFRLVAFILKVNADIERVADHAVSIAKVALRLDGLHPPRWPTALRDLGERVPAMCHTLLRSVLDEDARQAPSLVAEDETIDALERRLFDETVELMEKEPGSLRNGLLIYRVGRELERIGDLMKNIAEDLIYLATGDIVRHELKRNKPTV